VDVPDRRGRLRARPPRAARPAGRAAAAGRGGGKQRDLGVQSMPMTGDEFVKRKVSPEHRRTVATIRRLMREAAPGAKEVMTYGTLGWKNKGIIAVINPTIKYVTVAFLRGAEFKDKYGMLEGVGKVQKLVKIKYTDVNTNALRYYIRQALKFDKK
jgi:hypothetical protein